MDIFETLPSCTLLQFSVLKPLHSVHSILRVPPTLPDNLKHFFGRRKVKRLTRRANERATIVFSELVSY